MAFTTVKIEIKDSAGNWDDVSANVIMGAGVNIKRGRSSQFDTSSPGTCTFSVNNATGVFTPGTNSNGYKVNSQVRVTVNTVETWNGFIDSMSYTLREGFDQSVQINCTDKFKHYAKTSASSYGIERGDSLITRSGGATYSFEAPKYGYGSELEAFNNPSASRMTIVEDTVSGGYEFADDGPNFVKSCIRLKRGKTSRGTVLTHPTSFDPGSGTNVIQFWFKTDNAETGAFLAQMARVTGAGGLEVILQSDGGVQFSLVGSAANTIQYSTTKKGLYDGVWHHVGMYFDQTGGNTRLRTYIDGVSDGSGTAAGSLAIPSSTRRLHFGGYRYSGDSPVGNYFGLNGSFALVGSYTGVTSGLADFTDIYNAGATGQETTIATRLSRLSSIHGATGITTSSLSGITLSGQDISNKSYLQTVQEIADTEGGIFYIAQDGTPTFRGSGRRSSGTSVDYTINAVQDLTDEVTFLLDDSLFANTIIATSPSVTKTVVNAASVTALGSVVENYNTIVSNVSDLTTVATTRLDSRLFSGARISKVVIDCLTSPNLYDFYAQLINPLDRIRVTSLPSQAPSSTFDGFVEGTELNITDQSYTCSLDLSPVI
jgi:hypothetical protein